MAIIIRNVHLEERVANEASRRGSKTKAGTVEELLVERLTQIEMTNPDSSDAPGYADRKKRPSAK